MRSARHMLAALGATVAALWSSAVAQAQTYPPPIPEISPGAAGVTPQGPPASGAEVAYTGADITVGLLLLMALILGGAAALLLGRRRARSRG